MYVQLVLKFQINVTAGRFEEGVIEERRKAALELLTFAGSIPDLFTSQPFVKFFEVIKKFALE